jgi:hypothetical protein
MKRSDAALAALVVTSLAAAAAVWAPFVLPARVDVSIDAVPPRTQKLDKPTPPTPRSTPTTTWWTPTPGPTTAESPGYVDWAEEVKQKYLVGNKLYSAGRVPAVKCVLPTAALVSKSTLDSYIRAYMGCLDRAWSPLLKRAGHDFRPATLHLVKHNSEGACGAADSGVFYCRADHGIYIDTAVYLTNGSQQWRRVALLYAVSHEYGHHLQMLAGILLNNPEYSQTGAVMLESSRRLELQASCFAMTFLGANQQTLNLRGARLRLLSIGDGGDEDYPKTPRDHGSRKSFRYWEPAGFKAKNPAACNTWAASSSRVT